jgi:hypothetical protein
MFRLGVSLPASAIRGWPQTCSLCAAYSATLLMEQEVFPKRRCANTYSITFPHNVGGVWLVGHPFLLSGVRLTSHLHLVPKLRMSGATPPVCHMAEWRALGLLYLYLYLCLNVDDTNKVVKYQNIASWRRPSM